jgi:hypothetical protein
LFEQDDEARAVGRDGEVVDAEDFFGPFVDEVTFDVPDG